VTAATGPWLPAVKQPLAREAAPDGDLGSLQMRGALAEDYVPPGLVAMAEQECWDLLAEATTGRIAMPHDGRIWIIPVDHDPAARP
jgi:hypothetical protein